MRKIIIGFIKFYQKYISAFLGSYFKCRFNPSCSQYMIDAINKKGVIKGLMLGSWRILRCNPFCKGGDDFVK
jgi:putative membrane protein insertion efficiency factor